MEVQFLRYFNAQVYIFDKGGSSRAITAGVGGEHYDLGGETSRLSFQPLANIHHESERRFSHEWIIDLLVQENVPVTPKVKEDLWKALTSLSSAKIEERTLFGLTVLIQDELLRRALLPYTVQGAHGRLLDSSIDTLTYNRFQTFEMEALMETKSALMPVLSYLFHRLEQRFTGVPTMLVLDEAWIFLDHPSFAARIRQWLKTCRKANVMVVFATQSLVDIEKSPLAATLKESCFTKIFLPNPSALNESSSLLYERFGLNKRQIEILAFATPKKEYYYVSPLGNRLFDLSLGAVSLAYCGSTSREAQAVVSELNRKVSSTYDFNTKFLQMQNLEWAVSYINSLQLKEVA